MARKNSSKKRWPIILAAVFAFFILIGLLPESEEITSNPDVSPSISVPATTPEETPEAAPDSTVEPSESAAPAPTPTPTPKPTPEPDPVVDPEPIGMDYVLNTSSKKFHYPDCSSVKQMSEKNRATFTGTRDEIISKGYDPCGRCNP